MLPVWFVLSALAGTPAVTVLGWSESSGRAAIRLEEEVTDLGDSEPVDCRYAGMEGKPHVEVRLELWDARAAQRLETWTVYETVNEKERCTSFAASKAALDAAKARLQSEGITLGEHAITAFAAGEATVGGRVLGVTHGIEDAPRFAAFAEGRDGDRSRCDSLSVAADKIPWLEVNGCVGAMYIHTYSLEALGAVQTEGGVLLVLVERQGSMRGELVRPMLSMVPRARVRTQRLLIGAGFRASSQDQVEVLDLDVDRGLAAIRVVHRGDDNVACKYAGLDASAAGVTLGVYDLWAVGFAAPFVVYDPWGDCTDHGDAEKTLTLAKARFANERLDIGKKPTAVTADGKGVFTLSTPSGPVVVQTSGGRLTSGGKSLWDAHLGDDARGVSAWVQGDRAVFVVSGEYASVLSPPIPLH